MCTASFIPDLVSGAVFHWHPPDAGMIRRKKATIIGSLTGSCSITDNNGAGNLWHTILWKNYRCSRLKLLVLNQIFHHMRWLVFPMEMRNVMTFQQPHHHLSGGNLLGTLSASSAKQKWVWRLAGNFISLRLPFWRMLGCWRTAGLHVTCADTSELLLLLRL